MSVMEEKSHDFSDAFGGHLRMVRRQRRLSQAEFAKSLGISQGYLSDLERGNKRPSDTLLIALASRYGTVPGQPETTAPLAGVAGTIPLLGGIEPQKVADVIPGSSIDQVRLPRMDGARFAIIASGSFMAPTIVDGDLVVLAPASEVAPGEIVLLTNKWGEAILRRYRVKDGETFYSPDNSSYKPFAPDSDTRVLARVVAVWRSVLQ